MLVCMYACTCARVLDWAGRCCAVRCGAVRCLCGAGLGGAVLVLCGAGFIVGV